MGRLFTIIAVSFAIGCGGSANESNNLTEPNSDGDASRNNVSLNNSQTTGGESNTNNATNNTVFVPETEEFLVRTVATTEQFVFVPNGAEEGNTVARIDGRDLSVTPIPVGLRPTDVVAFDSDVGAVAFVLVEGTSSVAVIRADEDFDNPVDIVSLLEVPQEVNTLVASPDGRHVLAYIDPRRPFPDDSSVASLQAAALLRLGDTPSEDESHQLSLSRLIRDIEFTALGDEVFVVGREGVNRLTLADVTGDRFVPPLDLDLSDDVFPPTDLEVEVAPDGSFMALRSSAFSGLAIYSLADDGESQPVVLELPDIPTDIDLYVTDESREVVATVRDASVIARIDVDAALSSTPDDPYKPEIIDVPDANPGLAQLTPDRTNALLYSTLPTLPFLGVYSFLDEEVRTFALRNQIRSVAVAPDSATAVVVHTPQAEGTFFQTHEGLTIFDIATGYRRPVTLQSTPVETIMTTTEDGRSFVFVLLESAADTRQGVLRVDLQTYRSDFVPVVREPKQIGTVAGKVFVSQEADDGRITFIDVEALTQRTVSGYELNSGID